MLNWVKNFLSSTERPAGIGSVSDKGKELQAQHASSDQSIIYKEQGDAHLGQSNLERAAECYRQAIALDAGYAKAYSNLGFVLKEQGLHDDAESCFKHAIAIDPAIADTHYMLGTVLQARGMLDEAIAHFKTALELEPDFAFVYRDLCYLFFQRGQIDKAKQVITKGIALNPGFADLHYYLGNLHHEEKQLDLAIVCFQKALAIQPEYAQVHANLGLAFQKQGKLEEAIAACRNALALNPDYADAYNYLGIALQAQNKSDLAVECYSKALEINPADIDAHNNLGIALQSQKKFDDAVVSYQKALRINPDYANAHWNKSLLLLLIGEFLTGWREYEYRWKRSDPDPQPNFIQPIWLGAADLTGKSILLYAEQGLGDTLQFIRYIEKVAALGATIFLEVQAPLKSLLISFPGVARVFASGEPLPSFDYQCPLLSLPLAFKTELNSIPAKTSYISVPASRVQHWAMQLQDKPGSRIGVVWSGSFGHKNDHNRSINLEKLAPLWSHNRHRFFSLQKEIRATDAVLLRQTVALTNMAPHLIDFVETAAIIANLDLVITVDTSIAHLAGALGKQVWVLLPFVPDFRWLLDRTDTPWYPTARLFRQPAIGDWASVINEVRKELDAL